MRKTIPTLAIAATLAFAPAAHASSPDSQLRWLAAHVTHGWIDDKLPLSTLVAKLNHGQRIYVTCGTISRLGVQMLGYDGIRARLVGAVTMDRPDGVDDGHIMLEARLNGRWQVYDLDNNVQPLGTQDQGVSVGTFTRQHVHHLRVLAHDQKVDWRGTPYRAQLAWAYAPGGLERWYHHILGIPWVWQPGGSIYTGESRDTRVAWAQRLLPGSINLKPAAWLAKFYGERR